LATTMTTKMARMLEKPKKMPTAMAKAMGMIDSPVPLTRFIVGLSGFDCPKSTTAWQFRARGMPGRIFLWRCFWAVEARDDRRQTFNKSVKVIGIGRRLRRR